ncbi:putative MshA, mannose-sensitive haemaglutinin [Vibrio coralliirubri]|uniref:type IV pilin protein n=1 Tax=Vibrio coralliirubri TaxID=1516159 RepID=UPI0006331D9C|nr:type II secretion system protein [Vibrio coralliirubri]CDT85142.1 putative MshA, mannose-sensitive haemaglutinin [Vibrio coralliirubri]CDU02313.1 putative MshA, mannose-sensitive haemaglutinin [Vibrio coralliirubri]
MRNIRNVQGFSLFEMVIVIAVVGILAGAAIPSYFNVKDGAKEAIILNTLQSVVTSNSSVLGEALLEGKDDGREKLDEIQLWNGNIVMNSHNLRRVLNTNLEIIDFKLFNLPINEDSSIKHGLYVMHREDYETYKDSAVMPKCFVRAVQRKDEAGKVNINTNINKC